MILNFFRLCHGAIGSFRCVCVCVFQLNENEMNDDDDDDEI